MSEAHARADEADRLLNEPLLQAALKQIEDEALNELLTASGPNADVTREACANRINVARAMPQAIRAAMYAALDKVKPRRSAA